MLQYDVKEKYWLISRKFSGMKFFQPSSFDFRLTNPKATRVCIRSLNQSNRSIPSVSCFCFVRALSFQGHRKIALTNALHTVPVKFSKPIVQLLLLTEKKEVGEGGSTPAPTTTPGPTTPGTEVWWNVRLPDNIVPDHYDVVLYIDLKKLVFYGDVSILVNVTKPTENVLVHVNKMNITSAKVEMASSGGEKN